MPENTDIILVDFAPQPGVQVVAYTSPTQMYEQSAKAMEQAMSSIRGMATRVVDTIKSINYADQPSKVEVEFGLKLDADSGALVARAGAEVSITVKLTWERKEAQA